MRILFLCTAHNSLSQRLFLTLSRAHDVSIELALSNDSMISAVTAFAPDLILCPFLTTFVPREIYENVITLIVHPGPPGDAGPSAIDWLLLGDDGAVDDANELLKRADSDAYTPGRKFWGVSVLQAMETYDFGPVWAFEQFELDIDQHGLTKSELYRGLITHAAIVATLAAITRIQLAESSQTNINRTLAKECPSMLEVNLQYEKLSVSWKVPFKGGRLHHRPLLRAAQRQFDVSKHSAQQISRRLRSADSQPGVLSKIFGPDLYVYGGIIEDNTYGRISSLTGSLPTPILGYRDYAICIPTCDGKGVWITHVRRPKTKSDMALFPKVPAVLGLISLGLITLTDAQALHWHLPSSDWKRSLTSTFQEIWVDMQVDANLDKTAYLHYDFYNGAMCTDQCSRLVEAMDYIISQNTTEKPIRAVVLMGGSYFSNGINLSVIEAANDPSRESFLNINRINDVVHYLLHEFPSRSIVTVAAVRGNAAAGGVALAAACDIVVAGSGVVLNPAYRAVGLYGSEFHTLSYPSRCGEATAKSLLRSMTPISSLQAQSIGLVDYVFPGTGAVLDDYIRTHVTYMLKPGILKRGLWKHHVDTSPAALARVRAHELSEMSLDFWSPRAARYHTRRFDFVRKVKPECTPIRFATHRRVTDGAGMKRCDEEETEEFDNVEYFSEQARRSMLANVQRELSAVVLRGGALQKQGPEEVLLRVAPTPPLSPVTEKKKDTTVFPCYYKPVGEIPHSHAS